MNEQVAAQLEAEFGPLQSSAGVGGGCISPAFRVRTRAGADLFVKTARPSWPPDAFAEEARSLDRLRAADTLVIPRVLGVRPAWLALEWLEPMRPEHTSWTALGRGLARVHRVQAAQYGWDATNYIGPLPQTNPHTSRWPDFWRAERLGPQLQRAAPQLERGVMRDFERLLDQLDDRLGPGSEEGPSLLHGDLWSGNVHMCRAGAAIIDPASYNGHREVDLAMAALFGGFPRVFEEAYAAEWPLLADASKRRPVYQLYYLLIHVILFGGGYVGRTAATLRAALE